MSKKWDRLREDFRNTKNPAYFENTLISLANIVQANETKIEELKNEIETLKETKTIPIDAIETAVFLDQHEKWKIINKMEK